MSAYHTTIAPTTGRAILGNKTTNAKARLNQPTNTAKTPTVRELDGRTQLRPTTANRPKSSAPKTDSSKLQILLDHSDPLSDEVDTNPEPPQEAPYQSDVWAPGAITFDAAKPANRMTGYYDWYHNRRDENGETRIDREMKTQQEQRFRDAEAQIQKEIDEMTFDLGLDSPERKHILAPQDPNKKVVRPAVAAGKTIPSTLSSRRAASALGMAPPKTTSSTTATQRKPFGAKPTLLPSYMQPTRSRQQAPSTSTSSTTALASRPKLPTSSTAAGIAASHSTLGYTKGRTARTALHVRSASSSMASEAAAPPAAAAAVNIRAASSAQPFASNGTITPASYARDAADAKPEFVSIFDVPLDEDDADLFGSGTDGLFGDEEEEEFQMDLQL